MFIRFPFCNHVPLTTIINLPSTNKTKYINKRETNKTTHP